MEIAFVRHAETAVEARGRCYGSLDVGLSGAGAAQAAALGDVFALRPVTRVLSSPRLRARATAGPIADRHRLPVEVDDRLRELDFGELEGATYDEIAATRPALYEQWMTRPTEVLFPGGESYDLLRRRVRCALDEAVAGAGRDGLLVVVTHGGVVRVAVAEALGVPHERIFRIAVDPASVTRVTWVEGVPLVLGVNHRTGEDAVEAII